MRPIEHSTKTPTDRTGLLKMLRALFRVHKGRGASAILHRNVPVFLLGLAAAFALTTAPALAVQPEQPVTEVPSEITGTTATFEAELNPGVSTARVDYFFIYEEGSFPECQGNVERVAPYLPFPSVEAFPSVEGGHISVSAPVTGLEGSAKYTVCVYAQNSEGERRGKSVEFTMLAEKPIVTGERASTKAISATLEAQVNPENESTSCVFEYGSLIVNENVVPCEPAVLAGGQPQAARLPVSGLVSGTRYRYRVVTENATGRTEGKEEEFETPITPETPEKQTATEITASSARLNGVLNPKAAGSSSTYEFLYKQSASECKGGGRAPVPAGAATGGSPEPVSAVATGLLPKTTYTFCLRVLNSGAEEALGPPETFETLAAAPAIGETFATNVSAESATLHAELNPGGADTTYRFEDAVGGGEYAPVRGPRGESLPGAEGDAGAGIAGVPLEVHVLGLSPNTSYRFRLVASSAVLATVDGPEQTFTTQASGEFALPDGRQYEMVSPPQKQGSLFKSLFGKEEEGIAYAQAIVAQASVDGNAFVDEADQPTESEVQGDANGVSVFMVRGPAGWSSRVIAPPHSEATGSELGGSMEYRLFSEDLSHGVVQQFGNFTPLSPEATESTPYLRTNYLNGDVNEQCQGAYLSKSSCFEPLVTRGNTAPGTVFGDTINGECFFGYCGPLFAAATPDLSHIVLESRRRLTSTPVNTGKFEQRLFTTAYYEWYGGQLRLLNILPEQEEGGGAALAEGDKKHVISADGGRVLLIGYNVGDPGKRRLGLYLRDVAKGETVQLDLPEPGCGTCTGGAGAEYVKASSDLSRVFFLDPNKLTSDSGASNTGHGRERRRDLYECEIVEVADKDRCNLSDLTPETGGEAGNAQAVVGASEDGSYVYFVAGGNLAPGATGEQECGNNDLSGACNLYVRHNGATDFIAKLSGPKDSSYYIYEGAGFGGNTQLSKQSTRVSANGRWLAFMSSGDLTGYDPRDAVTGTPDEEVYLYDAGTSKLACASCDPTGARPVGVKGVASVVPGWDQYTGGAYNFGDVYQTRYLSNSGRLFFDSKDALVPLDVNGVVDVYEYEPAGVPAGEHACGSASASGSDVFKPAHSFEVEGRSVEEPAGCVALISSGASSEQSTFLDASETGGDVFFMTTSKIARQDFDHAYDIYDAQECTSAAPCLPTLSEQPPPCETEGSCRAASAPRPAIYGAPSSATFDGAGNLPQPLPSRAVSKTKKKQPKCKKGLVRRKGKCVKKKSRKKAKRAVRVDNNRRGK